jgi:hypothetical protein
LNPPVIIKTEFGVFTFQQCGKNSVTLSGDAAHLFDLEQMIRRRHPDFNLGLSADSIHGYNANCKLSKPNCALVFGAVFATLTRP